MDKLERNACPKCGIDKWKVLQVKHAPRTVYEKTNRLNPWQFYYQCAGCGYKFFNKVITNA